MARLKKLYKEQICKDIQKKFAYQNSHQVGKILKVVLSMGLNKSLDVDKSFKDLTTIAGQTPVKVLAKKSVAQFKIRKGEVNGLKVTLRNELMYYFLDRLANAALLNWSSFPGIQSSSMMQLGNQICLSFGIPDQKNFPEIYVSGTRRQGLNVTICSNCQSKEEFQFLLTELGLPMRGV